MTIRKLDTSIFNKKFGGEHQAHRSGMSPESWSTKQMTPTAMSKNSPMTRRNASINQVKSIIKDIKSKG